LSIHFYLNEIFIRGLHLSYLFAIEEELQIDAGVQFDLELLKVFIDKAINDLWIIRLLQQNLIF